MKTINDQLAKPLELGLLTSVFKNNWDAFATKIASFRDVNNGGARAQPNSNDMIQEILSTVRRLEREAAAQAERLKRGVPYISRFAGRGSPTEGALSQIFSDERRRERLNAILAHVDTDKMSDETFGRLAADMQLAYSFPEKVESAAPTGDVAKGNEKPT